MTADEQLTQLIIPNPTISLKKGEVCLYEGEAKAMNARLVTESGDSVGAGFTWRISKHFALYSGGGKSKKVQKTVIDEYPGKFYLTNRRMILLAPKFGFEASLQNVNRLENSPDGFVIYVNAKPHYVGTTDVDQIVNIIRLLNQSYLDQQK